jgi:NADH:ubiquinone reductase (H+-translocating)
MTRLVIIGAGFAGLKLAKSLRKNKEFQITIIDKVNHHQFQPLFYQVATAGLDASNISFPLRKIFQKQSNISIRLNEVTAIDIVNKTVVTEDQVIPYDELVIATGATTNFFNHPNIQKNTLGMKSTLDAINIRNHFLLNLEEAVNKNHQINIAPYLNICIVGGGPTGVELAGAFAEMKNNILPKDYPEIDFSQMNIYLFEGSATTLEVMSPKSALNSMNYLKKLGVQVNANTKVTDFDGTTLITNTNLAIPTYNVIWAAGIKGNTIPGISESAVGRANRLLVNEYNQVHNHQHIYAVGDIALMQTTNYPNGHPQIAPVAIQQAKLLKQNLLNLQKAKPLCSFVYKPMGAMATVGRNLAVVDIPKPKLSIGGFSAWMIWMGLHLLLILGIKNKLFIFFNWVYNYFTYDQSLRLVFPKNNQRSK